MAAELAAHEGSDEELVDALFRLVLRREPEPEARERALAQLADGTLSRATLVHELATSEEFRRVRELDDAVALGLAARARGERMRWLQAPPGTDERVSRSRGCSRAFSRPAGCSRSATRSRSPPISRGCCERASSWSEWTSRSATSKASRQSRRTSARSRSRIARSTRFSSCRRSSTSVPTTACTASPRSATAVTRDVAALRELARVLRPRGSLLLTVPLGEPGDHGWFRQEDEQGWTSLLRARGSSSRSSSRTS